MISLVTRYDRVIQRLGARVPDAFLLLVAYCILPMAHTSCSAQNTRCR